MAVQRAGAAQAHLPRGHQADPEKLPQSGWSVLQFSTPLRPKRKSGKYQHMSVCVLQVIILDPVQEYAAELLSVAEMFYTNNIPLRFALCFDELEINTCTVRLVAPVKLFYGISLCQRRRYIF